jgi:diguanylate cyclase (GGDEF)-like protein/PAS domain S-box-containing protein
MTGYARSEVIGRTPALLQGPDTDRHETHALRLALEAGRTFEASTINYRKNGEPFHIQWRTAPVRDASGKVTHYIAVQRDITAEVHLIERLQKEADLDGLTGLFNRSGGERHLEKALARQRVSGERLTLLLIDIDHFKRVNDAFGHAVGDQVLRRVAGLIAGRTRGNDIAVRWGGEEFLVGLIDTPLGGGVRVAESIRMVVDATPFPSSVSVSLSAGVAELRKGESLAQTIERADLRLYAAKRAGRNTTCADGEADELRRQHDG